MAERTEIALERYLLERVAELEKLGKDVCVYREILSYLHEHKEPIPLSVGENIG